MRTKYEKGRKYYHGEIVRTTENVLEMFDFMAGVKRGEEDMPKEECKKHYGVYICEDGEEEAITSAAMQQMCEMLDFIKQSREDYERILRQNRTERDELTRKLKRAREYAAMSDERIADELDREIDSFNAHAGEESLIYGPVELMGYCRDRLRNTRTRS